MTKKPPSKGETKTPTSRDASARGAPMRGPKTKTLPEEQRGLWFEGVDQVSAIAVFGSTLVFDLAPNIGRFTLGSGEDCDIAIPTEFLSRLHLVMERRGAKIRVTDQGSKNGTFVDDTRDAVFDVRAGDTFYAGSIRFLLMNDVMRKLHPTFVELLGGDDGTALYNEAFKSRPSDAMVAAVGTTQNILITGEPGCDHVRLARAMHQVSRLRERECIEVDANDLPADRIGQRKLIDAAARSTMILRIGENTPILDGAFASSIFSTSFHIRVFTCAPQLQMAMHVLTEAHVRTMGNIELLPLVRRKGSICRLLDRVLAEMGSGLRATAMTADNQAGLEGYDWPGNFNELRSVAGELDHIFRAGSLRRAAEQRKVPRATYHHQLQKVGVSSPLIAEPK